MLVGVNLPKCTLERNLVILIKRYILVNSVFHSQVKFSAAPTEISTIIVTALL